MVQPTGEINRSAKSLTRLITIRFKRLSQRKTGNWSSLSKKRKITISISRAVCLLTFFQYLLISSFLIQACYHRGTNFASPQVMWKFQLVCPGVLKLPDYGQVCNFDFRIVLLETHPTA